MNGWMRSSVYVEEENGKKKQGNSWSSLVVRNSWTPKEISRET